MDKAGAAVQGVRLSGGGGGSSGGGRAAAGRQQPQLSPTQSAQKPSQLLTGLTARTGRGTLVRFGAGRQAGRRS